MRTNLLALASGAVETIVIQDNNGKDSLGVWLAGVVVIIILYMIVMLIHDVRRDLKLEKLKAEKEAQKEAELINDIDI